MTRRKRKKVYIKLIVGLLCQIKSEDEIKKIYEFALPIWHKQWQMQQQRRRLFLKRSCNNS